MRVFLIVLVIFLLASCAVLEERPVIVGNETRIITLKRTYNATNECISLGAKAPPNWKVEACAQFNQTNCLILMKPDATDETLGHEARHCFDGSWHR